VKKPTWVFLATLRWVLGLSLGLAGLRLIGSQHWGKEVVFVASGVVAILAISLINYGPRTYEEYCKEQQKPD